MPHTTFVDDGPDDVFVTLNGVREGFRCLRDPESGLLSYRAGFVDEQVPQYTTDAFSYRSVPSTVEQPVTADDWSLGAGFVSAPVGSLEFSGYSYSQGVNASEGDRLYLSFAKTALTGDAGAATKFYRSPTFGYYKLEGQFVYQFAGGAWVQRYDAGAGVTVTDIIEYANSVDEYLFIALGTSADIRYSTDGTTFGTAVTSEKAKLFAVRGATSVEPIIWAIKENGFIRSSNAGISGWSNEDQIGSRGEKTTGFVVANDLLWIFKEEGYYTFDGTNISVQANVTSMKTADNGKYATVDIAGFILVNYGNRILRINPYENSVATLWETAHPELAGTIAGITATPKDIYFLLNTLGGNVYVMRGGVSKPFHTWAYTSSTTGSGLIVGDKTFFHTTNPALVVALGSASHIYILPRDGARPEDDPNVKFDTAVGTLYGSWLDVGALVYDKYINGSHGVTENSSGANVAKLYYGADGSADTSLLLTCDQPGVVEDHLDTSVTVTRLRHVVTMETGDQWTSPRVIGMSIDVTPAPPRHKIWDMLFTVESDGDPRGGGEADPRSYTYLRSFLNACVGKEVTFEDYFGTSYLAKVLTAAGQGLRRKTGGQGRAHALEHVQVIVVEIDQNFDASNIFTWDQSFWGSGDVWDAD